MISSWKGVTRKEISSISNLIPLKISVLNFGFNLNEILNPFVTKVDCSNYIIPDNISADLLFIVYSSLDTKSKEVIIDKINYLKNKCTVVIGIDVNNNEDLNYKIFDSYINNSKIRLIIEGISDTITKPNLISVDGGDLVNFFKNGEKFYFSTINAKGEEKGPSVLYDFNSKIGRNYKNILLNLYSKSSDFSFSDMDYIMKYIIYDEDNINNIITHTYNENLNDEYFGIILFKITKNG